MGTTKHLAIALVALACSRSPSAAPHTQTATPQHHEIRADQLPKPYATESAGNPPRVIKRPRNAKLTVPPGFHVAVWAEGFDDPRNMIQVPNGDVLLADT